MSDLTLFVLETDLGDLSDGQIEKIEEILLRNKRSTMATIDDIDSALMCLRDARDKPANVDEVSTTRKTPATTRKTPATTRKTPVTTRKTPATTRKTPVTTRKTPVGVIN